MRPDIKSSKAAPIFEGAALRVWGPLLLALILLSAAAIWYFSSHGWLLYYGDAEAHLNTARRQFDSQTPGYDQIGTVWLPLPHWLMVPFVRVDGLWYSGLAGSIPSGAAFVIGGMFLFGAARRVFQSTAAGIAAAALAALNPNLLYLQSLAMTEAIFFGSLMGLLYCSVRFRDTQGWSSIAGAGIATCAGALTRYEGWILIPFVALYFLWAAKRQRWAFALGYCVLAAIAPLYWMGSNWYLTGDALDFYRGPYSPRAIQGDALYPGWGNWHVAWYYYRKAAELCAGPALGTMAIAGIVVAFVRRIFWPLLLTGLPGLFVILSMYRGVVPIFMPILWPFSYYNTRYGVAVLALLALTAAGLVTLAPDRWRGLAAILVIAIGITPWLVHPGHEHWITWAESRANSEGRRGWMREAAEFVGARFVRDSGIITSSGDDFSGIYREMRIPLSETFSVCNGLPWLATLARPDLFMHQEWALVKSGDQVDQAIQLAGRYGLKYALQKTIVKKDEPVVKIYRRIGDNDGIP